MLTVRMILLVKVMHRVQIVTYVPPTCSQKLKLAKNQHTLRELKTTSTLLAGRV